MTAKTELPDEFVKVTFIWSGPFGTWTLRYEAVPTVMMLLQPSCKMSTSRMNKELSINPIFMHARAPKWISIAGYTIPFLSSLRYKEGTSSGVMKAIVHAMLRVVIELLFL